MGVQVDLVHVAPLQRRSPSGFGQELEVAQRDVAHGTPVSRSTRSAISATVRWPSAQYCSSAEPSWKPRPASSLSSPIGGPHRGRARLARPCPHRSAPGAAGSATSAAASARHGCIGRQRRGACTVADLAARSRHSSRGLHVDGLLAARPRCRRPSAGPTGASVRSAASMRSAQKALRRR